MELDCVFGRHYLHKSTLWPLTTFLGCHFSFLLGSQSAELVPTLLCYGNCFSWLCTAPEAAARRLRSWNGAYKSLCRFYRIICLCRKILITGFGEWGVCVLGETIPFSRASHGSLPSLGQLYSKHQQGAIRQGLWARTLILFPGCHTAAACLPSV